MTERPILFSAPMVRAILDGRKTQTRRIVKSQIPIIRKGSVDEWNRARDPRLAEKKNELRAHVFIGETRHWSGVFGLPCPYGKPGDKLWVRETFYCDEFDYPNGPVAALKAALDYRATHDCSNWEAGCPCLDDEGCSAWRPSIHMPRWASRITLEITGIRVERLQEISEADARAEGIESELVHPPSGYDPDNYHPPGAYGYVSGAHDFPKGKLHVRAVDAYAELWESINGKGSWAANTWVWVVEFKGGAR